MEFLIDILFVFMPAFAAGMIAYSLYSIYQTRKVFKCKPKLLGLDLPTHLGFKITHQVDVDHWVYDKDFGITSELRTIYAVIDKYQELVSTGVTLMLILKMELLQLPIQMK